MAYQLNDVPRFTGTFTNASAVVTDPTAVTFTYTTPAGVATTLTYGTDAAVVRSSTGVYYVDLALTTVGGWTLTWRGTGTVADADTTTITVGPDSLDVLTLIEAHAAINLADSVTTQDTKLAMFNTAVSRRLDDLCGPIVVRTLTAEAYDGTDEEDYERNSWNARGEAFTHSGRPVGGVSPLLGRTTLWLRSYPVSSVTTITEYAATTGSALTADSTTVLSGTGYSVNTRTGALTRRSGGRDWYFPTGRNNILVTYIAGRAANTASVDARFKIAASIILNHVWRPQAGAWAQTANPYQDTIAPMEPLMPGYAIPNAALEWIADDLHQDRYLV